jgi:mono/diheme cytochrome c family protein
MYPKSNRTLARRLLALGFGLLTIAAILRCSTGSVSDLSLGKGTAPGDPGRSRSPYRTDPRSPHCIDPRFPHRIDPQEPRRNPEAQKLKNPEAPNADSVEAGKKIYQRFCASCHGPQGKGDGSLALAGGTPSDLTDETWDFGSTDGEIFVAIRDGVSTDMLAYKEKLSDKQIWQVVNYLRSIGPKTKDDK